MTSTPDFGSNKREGHDSSAFYARFPVPEISTDETVYDGDRFADVIHCGDARDMRNVPDNSVALVVTSPPYFVGKVYENVGGWVPNTYAEYLTMLRDVFAECKRVLEPGGRIAVNVANLGRKPYRSLSGDVTGILMDLGLLLRGEVVWWKGAAAGGSCAWGSFQSPHNPVLRDVTERIVIASKGRFDRAIKPIDRSAQGLPSTTTISRDEFLAATTDLWEIPPESATRIGHPAPFPTAIPRRLIELYTYAGDVVLDPFMGSGSTAVAAVLTGRSYLGFDTERVYVDSARERISAARALAKQTPVAKGPAVVTPTTESRVQIMTSLGLSAKDVARQILVDGGFTDIRQDVKFGHLGVSVSFVARDKIGMGNDWAFEVVGGTGVATPTGLSKVPTLMRTLGKAAVLQQDSSPIPLVILTTDKPGSRTPGDKALSSQLGPGGSVTDVIVIGDSEDRLRLGVHASHGYPFTWTG